MANRASIQPQAFEMRSGGVSIAACLRQYAGKKNSVLLQLGLANPAAPQVTQEMSPAAAEELGQALLRLAELARDPGGFPE